MGVAELLRFKPRERFLFEEGQDRDLFPPCLPENQLQACLQSVHNAGVVASLDPQGIPSYKRKFQDEIMEEMAQLAEGDTSTVDTQKAISLTVAFIDTLCSDNIASGNVPLHQQPPAKSTYFREYGDVYNGSKDIVFPARGIATVAFMTEAERREVMEQLKADPQSTFLTGDFFTATKAIKNINLVVPTTQPMTEDFANVGLHAARLDKRKNVLFVPFRVNSNVGGLLKVGRTPDKFLYPRSEMPRQDIWAAYLESGITLFPLFKNMPEQPETAEGDSKKPKDYQLLERKNRIWLGHSEDREAQERFVQKHKEHYKRVLGRKHPLFGDPEVILTRSGVSANESVVRAISQLEGPTVPTQVMSGFYYENIPSFARYTNMFDTTGNNRVFCLGAEPSSPIFADGEEHKIEYPKLITTFLDQARQNDGQQYYLVIDKTTDPLFASFQEDEELPGNVTIIESLSLTKHQRGGRNYFFGAVLVWGDKSHAQAIEDQVIPTRGSVTPLQAMHFPRVTRAELQEAQNYRNSIKRAITEAVAEGQSKIPEDKRWSVEAYNMFAFLIPPLQHIMDELFDGKRRINTESFGNYLSDRKASSFDAEDILLKFSGLVHGDSFGLNDTRVCDFPADFTTSNNEIVEFRVPRVSYGLQASPEQLALAVKETCLELARRLQTPPIQDPLIYPFDFVNLPV